MLANLPVERGDSTVQLHAVQHVLPVNVELLQLKKNVTAVAVDFAQTNVGFRPVL